MCHKLSGMILAAAVALATVQSGYAITFDDGGVHDITTPIPEEVNVRDWTTVNMLPGGSVTTVNAIYSTVNISGGSVTDVNAALYSTVNISGGSVRGSGESSPIGVTASDGAVVNISGGDIVGSVTAPIYGTVNISGGDIVGSVSASIYSTVNIRGGHIGGDIACDNFGTVTISGGAFAEGVGIQAFGINRETNGCGQVYIYGMDFNYPEGPITDMSGTITGTLRDCSTFHLDFSRTEGSTITLSSLVPEPSSIALLTVAALSLFAYAWRRRA